MKPILIYTMSRTRGTATLQACNRQIKYNEPFDFYNLSSFDKSFSDNFYLNGIKALIDFNDWDTMTDQLNDPNSVTKIFGHSLAFYYPARAWFANTIHSHDTYVLVRNVREMILSELLAVYFGYVAKDKEPESIIIDENLLMNASNIIAAFLRFYPAHGKLVTFETLPEHTFDKSLITHVEQHSNKKLALIKNLDQVEQNIKLIMDYHSTEFMVKTGVDIFSIP